MKAKRIVVPTDFSHCGDTALDFATTLARDSGATLFLVHGEEPAVAYAGGDMYYGVLEPDHTELQRMLHEVKPTDPKVPFEHHLLRGVGNAAIQIVEFAKEIEADMIVMATHGRTGISRMLMGSVAEAVVRRASCPVLIVRAPSKKPAAAS